MRHESSGKCHCEKVTFSICLPDELEKYRPRKCDCDFCMGRNASYLSHPDGSLHIVTSDQLAVIKHGSKQASFLTCSSCGSLVSVVHQFHDGLKGTVNATLLTESERLKDPVVVSPKLLEPEEKLSRWKSVWLSVSVNGNDHISRESTVARKLARNSKLLRSFPSRYCGVIADQPASGMCRQATPSIPAARGQSTPQQLAS